MPAHYHQRRHRLPSATSQCSTAGGPARAPPPASPALRTWGCPRLLPMCGPSLREDVGATGGYTGSTPPRRLEQAACWSYTRCRSNGQSNQSKKCCCFSSKPGKPDSRVDRRDSAHCLQLLLTVSCKLLRHPTLALSRRNTSALIPVCMLWSQGPASVAL